ncbi:MAG: M48 family metallopeptidase [Candidatus Binatia bacterium]|nr:M48 family metallopeptidase [Candidatus Binatia bacterium]
MGRKFVSAIVLLATTASCGVSLMERRQLLMLSDDRVDQQELALYAQCKRDVPISKSGGDQKYVGCGTEALATEVADGDIPDSWEVNTFKDDSPNAFAIPGGKIGVHTCLLDVADNQDQLAAGLGHEVSRVLARHSNERMSANQATGMLMAGTQTSGAVHPDVMSAFGVGAQYRLILAYGRARESEADFMGLDLMAQAGFDPREAVVFWNNMDEAASASGGQAPPDFLSTHPGSATRNHDLNERMPTAMQLNQQARAQGKKLRCTR